MSLGTMDKTGRRRRVLGACGVALCTLSCYLLRLYRGRRSMRVRDAVQQRRDGLAARATLPLYVDHDALPSPWQVLTPVYYPPHRAALLLGRPALLSPAASGGAEGRSAGYEASLCSEQSVLVLCEGPLCDVDGDQAAVLERHLRAHPMFRSMLDTKADGQLFPVAELLPQSTSTVFSHALLHHRTLVLCGLNGCFVSLLAWELGADGATSSGEDKTDEAKVVVESNKCVAVTALQAQEQVMVCAVLAAIHPVTLVRDGAVPRRWPRPPGAPVGVQGGEYRATCAAAGRVAVFRVPAWLAVYDAAAPSPLLYFAPAPCWPYARPADGFALSAQDFATLCAAATPGQDCSLAECLQRTDEVTRAVRVCVTQRETDEGGHVTLVYTHEMMGISFGVDPRHGRVLDCPLANDLQIVYYPFGLTALNSDQGMHETNDGVDGAPRVVLRYMTKLPSTWERVARDEAELRHNVLLHFTDWVREQTPCTVTELSGLRCVYFTETKEQRRCRTYVVPRADDTVLVILVEAAVADWERHESHLEAFMDTLSLKEETH